MIILTKGTPVELHHIHLGPEKLILCNTLAKRFLCPHHWLILLSQQIIVILHHAHSWNGTSSVCHQIVQHATDNCQVAELFW